VGGQRHALADLPPGNSPGTHYTGGLMGSRASLEECESLAPTGIRPARTELLYRLSLPGTSLPCKQLQEQNSTACSIHHISQTHKYEGLGVYLVYQDMKVPSATGIIQC
jgi:hypothetical protein